MNTYEQIRYSKSQIKKAGQRISKCMEGTPEYAKYIEIIDNWRAVHACPLANIAKEINDILICKDNFLIVQRLKRQESIIGKLCRPNNTGLDRMQDLAGCRVIVPTVDDVYETVSTITEHLRRQGHEIEREDDYLDKFQLILDIGAIILLLSIIAMIVMIICMLKYKSEQRFKIHGQPL